MNLTQIADLALRFGRVDRATLHPDGVRHESDTDHTVMLVEVLRPELAGRVVWEPYGGGGAFCAALGPIVDALLVTDCDVAADALARFPAVATFTRAHDVSAGLKRDWLWDVAVPDEMLWIRERIAFEGPGREGKGGRGAPARRPVAGTGRGGEQDREVRIEQGERWVRHDPVRAGPAVGETDMRDYAWVIWRKRAGSWMGRGRMGRVSTVTGRVWRGVDCG